MRKLGGIALILVGVVLVAFAAMRAFSVLSIFLGEEASAYGVGFLTGTVVLVILLSFLGIKSISKGRILMRPTGA